MNLRHRHESIQNPKIPLQRRLNPIRNRRAPEVFFYLWCRGVPINPLYEVGSGRVGCWISPAMLESEWAIVKEFHPALRERWVDALLERGSFPRSYYMAGLWRWRNPPPKARMCAEIPGIGLP